MSDLVVPTGGRQVLVIGGIARDFQLPRQALIMHPKTKEDLVKVIEAQAPVVQGPPSRQQRRRANFDRELIQTRRLGLPRKKRRALARRKNGYRD